MASEITGSYIPFEHVEAIRARVEVLAAQVQELLHEVQSVACIDITIRKPQAAAPAVKAKAEPKPKARAKAPSPTEADIQEARAKLEKAATPAKPAKQADDKPVVPRQRFGKLRESLLVDFGPEVADHMVKMCGNDKVTLTLRKQRDRFIGTYPSRVAAARAYAYMVGTPDPDTIDADQILNDLSDVVEHDDGQVSVWGNEGDEPALARRRKEDEASPPASYEEADAATA